MPPSETDTERTPLLVNSVDLDEPEPKPLPWRPIVVLLLLNAVQPLAYELVFPFISTSQRSSPTGAREAQWEYTRSNAR